MKDNATVKDHILSIVWVYFLLFPTGNLFYVSIPLILLLLFDSKAGGIKKEIIPMLVLLFITIVVNISEPYMGFKPIVRLATMAIVFITFASVKGSRILFPYILFSTLFIFLSQVCFLFDVSYLTSFFNQFYDLTEKGLDLYGISEHSLEIEKVAAGSTRLGGIYYNPNNCASYISVIYAMGLYEIGRSKVNKFQTILFITLVFLSIIISGSRTSFVVIGLISLYYLHVKGKSIKKYWPLGVLFALLLIINASVFKELRMFKVGEGMDNSFGVKMAYFARYLSDADSIIQLMFGAGDQEVTVYKYHSRIPGTDCDLGDIFITFGFFFYFAYFAFYLILYKKYTPIHRILLIVLLWSFSNSLLESYRMCPVWFLSLGVFYKQSLEIKAIERRQRMTQQQIQ